jgi:hypothetical protein
MCLLNIAHVRNNRDFFKCDWFLLYFSKRTSSTPSYSIFNEKEFLIIFFHLTKLKAFQVQSNVVPQNYM